MGKSRKRRKSNNQQQHQKIRTTRPTPSSLSSSTLSSPSLLLPYTPSGTDEKKSGSKKNRQHYYLSSSQHHPDSSGSSSKLRIGNENDDDGDDTTNDRTGIDNSTVLLPQTFPLHLPRPKNDFLRNEEPYKASFQAAIDGPYEGFVVDTPTDLRRNNNSSNCRSSDGGSYYGNVPVLPNIISSTIDEDMIQSSLDGLYQHGYFRTDVTQPFGLGTKCAKTYVTRCLVGRPGTTYKYLGLRMFAHPYDEHVDVETVAVDDEDDMTKNNNKNKKKKKEKRENPYTRTIQALGLALTERTKVHLHNLDTKRKQQLLQTGRNSTIRTKTTTTTTIRGRPDFDICLINRMEYSDDLKDVVMMEQQPTNTSTSIGKSSSSNNNNSNTNKSGSTFATAVGKTTVSWHADSSLEHYSTIAVYQTLQTVQNKNTKNDDGSCLPHLHDQHYTSSKSQQEGQQRKIHQKKNATTTIVGTNEGQEQQQQQWWVALRVAHFTEGPQSSQRRRGADIESTIVKETPPIAVCLPSGSAYYLLDDFNHHHQHTVLTTKGDGTASAGGQVVRYSCTFRLLRDSHNVHDWLTRGRSAVSQFHKKGGKLWRSEQLLLTTIETEWIRQFYIQGMKHYELLWDSYWKDPMQELLVIWSQLERRTCQTVDLLRSAAEGRCFNDVSTMPNNDLCNERPTKAERKARDRRKKAMAVVQDLLSRGSGGKNNNNNKCAHLALVELYRPMADLLDERAEMRELWRKREKDHVFRELPPDCRPIPVPFQFDRPIDEKVTGVFGSSPLPECPIKLKELASNLRQLGEAYQDGDRNRLPLLAPSTADSNIHERNTQPEEPHQQKQKLAIDSEHANSVDWDGWNSSGCIFGLELQQPWAGTIVDGKKTIETRLYTLPRALIGKKIMIIESSLGKDGVSNLGNVIDFSSSSNKARVIGWCTFSNVKIYKKRESFEADEKLHLVSPESGYGWKDTTKEVYGWVVGEYGRLPTKQLDDGGGNDDCGYNSGIRRMRSIFELLLKRNGGTSDNIIPTKEIMKERKRSRNHHHGRNAVKTTTATSSSDQSVPSKPAKKKKKRF